MNNLTILQYNIFCRHTLLFSDGQLDRINKIPSTLSKYEKENNVEIDVITIYELFDKSCMEKLIKIFSDYGFKYITDVICSKCDDIIIKKNRIILSNGGTMIFSKYPLTDIDYYIYDNTNGTDALAAKGFIYAKVEKHNKFYNIITTHLQAWDEIENREIRLLQINELNNYLIKKNIHESQLLIIIGDLNIDCFKYKKDLNYVSKILDCTMTNILFNEGERYSYNPNNNTLAGRDGQLEPYKSELLDYCFYSNKHLQPISNYSIIIKLKSDEKIIYDEYFFTSMIKNVTYDLSDHYPVISYFEF